MNTIRLNLILSCLQKNSIILKGSDYLGRFSRKSLSFNGMFKFPDKFSHKTLTAMDSVSDQAHGTLKQRARPFLLSTMTSLQDPK